MSDIDKLIHTIEAYPFESEGGPLHLCIHWMQLKEKLAAALALSEERRAMLEKHQWADEWEGSKFCPECSCGKFGHVHAPDCELARLIRKEKK